MAGRLSRVTGPAIEPVSLAEALVQCRAMAGVEDAWFNDAIRAAREEAENTQWRAFITQTWDLWFDGFPTMPIDIPRPPLVSVQSVSVYDIANAETVVPVADYFVDRSTEPGRIAFSYGATWPVIEPRELSTVRVRFACGYGMFATDVPRYVKLAILLYIGYMYENRAGEVVKIPDAFYHLLGRERMYQ